jgi:hypothetical protein
VYFSGDGDKEANMNARVGVGPCELDNAIKEI